MTINVTNCGDCIFRESDFDSDSLGKDTVDSCILIRQIMYNNPKYWNYHIASYNSFTDEGEQYYPKELQTTLPNCPLKGQEITVKLNI